MNAWSDATGGSSPLVRGKLYFGGYFYGVSGLIPAGAGKTVGGRARRHSERAHPRWCGENHQQLGALGLRPGSSPLVRGKRGHKKAPHKVPGLIPAGAGKTVDVPRWADTVEAHPRWCGENGF